MNTVIAEYIWIDGDLAIRSKTRVINVVEYIDYSRNILDIKCFPQWNYDGSSTNQATCNDSEIVLRPCQVYPCPFRYSGYIVLCDTYLPNGNPAKNNHRHAAKKIFDTYHQEMPWYGLEQEYFMIDPLTGKPFGHNHHDGRYYCSVGAKVAYHRELVEKHLQCCLYAGLSISGVNAEVEPGQWEFQIGPVEGIEASDQLWVARYILNRLSEQYNIIINYHPKPVTDDRWNGSGCHINFSTANMRKPGGFDLIISVMDRLKLRHAEHLAIYGQDNHRRLTGRNETSDPDVFTYGVGDRTASVRIPLDTKLNGMGYLEDRRPGSNIDPYQCTSLILDTVRKIDNQANNAQ